MQKITPFLWFDGRAEEAAEFYVSVFKDGKIGKIARYNDQGPGPAGSVMTVEFEVAGLAFVALNGGPQFKFTEAVSFQVLCDTQEEVDRYWTRLTEDGGEPGPCGWCKDRFGLSWQITPRMLMEAVGGHDAGRAGRVMAAMMQMSKLDIAKLEEAAAG